MTDPILDRQPCRLSILSTVYTDHDFGCVDARGRKMGAYIEHRVFEWIPDETSCRLPAPSHVGHVRYGYRPQATRDGKSYGACQQLLSFATRAECDAAVLKYLASARKRAQAKGGK